MCIISRGPSYGSFTPWAVNPFLLGNISYFHLPLFSLPYTVPINWKNGLSTHQVHSSPSFLQTPIFSLDSKVCFRSCLCFAYVTWILKRVWHHFISSWCKTSQLQFLLQGYLSTFAWFCNKAEKEVKGQTWLQTMASHVLLWLSEQLEHCYSILGLFSVSCKWPAAITTS